MGSEREILIEIEDVRYTYNRGLEDEVEALSGISFAVRRGDFIALTGRNGSGKSTLARLMNGLYLPDTGSVKVKGIPTSDDKRTFEVRSSVGVVFQNPDNQMVTSIIEDDVAFGPENLGVPREEIRVRVDEALEAVGMSEHKKGTPFRLSGGQKQRIAIAGILAMRPDVLVLDEATAMLDPRGRKEIMEVVMKLRESYGTTVIVITHFPEEAALADRVIVLDGGKIALDGAAKDVLSDVKKLEELGLKSPLAARLAASLRDDGIIGGEKIIDIEELGRALK